MRRWAWLAILTTAAATASAQRRWDGEGGDSLWQNARNWQPDGVPLREDTVLLDHSLTTPDYRVHLPGGSTSVTIRSLRILPGTGRRITLVLPASNTAIPGLQVTDTGECIRLDAGACLRNASGAASGEPLQCNGRLRISDGATYVHNTSRGNARLIDLLSQAPGTENGVFEFDVPGAAGYTVSLTGNTFGSLAFSASAAGSAKSYSGSGTSNCIVRGSLRIDPGAALTSTLTSDILLYGDLAVDGTLNLSPATAGSTGRSLLFCGSTPQRLTGNGQFLAANSFRNVECRSGSRLQLVRDLRLPQAGQSFLVNDNATLDFGIHAILGEGIFRALPGCSLDMGSPYGLRASEPLGNVQTRIRDLSPAASYRFTGTAQQSTGNGLPDSIRSLTIDKPQGALILSKPVRVTGALGLTRGRILSRTDSILTLDGATVSSRFFVYGGSDTGWDSSFVEGPLRIRIRQTGSLPLPLGSDSVHAPARIEAVQPVPVTVRAEYRNATAMETIGPVAAGIRRILAPGYWEIRPDSTGQSLSAFLAFSWRYNGDSLSARLRKDSLQVAFASTTGGAPVWERAGISHNLTGEARKGWIRPSQALTAFGRFALATGMPDAALPLTAIHLSAETRGQRVRLEWRVEGSEGRASFCVERSREGGRFEGIARMEAQGIRQGHAFSHTDERPPPGRNLYRVSALTDGNEALLSPVREVWVRGADATRIYPNPVQDILHLRWVDRKDEGSGEVIDMSGRLRIRLQLPAGIDRTIDLRGLPPGAYLLRIRWDGRSETHRFIVSDAARQ